MIAIEAESALESVFGLLYPHQAYVREDRENLILGNWYIHKYDVRYIDRIDVVRSYGPKGGNAIKITFTAGYVKIVEPGCI